MSGDTQRVPRQPKLRASCDACGAAKLKCDRGQPECGRCVSYGISCLYGISRKKGKPPRDRLCSGLTRTSNDQTIAADVDKLDSNSSSGSGMVLDRGPFSGFNDVAGSWDPMDDGSNGLLIDLDTFDPLGRSMLNFNSPDFNELAVSSRSSDNLLSANPQYGPTSNPESPNPRCYSPLGLQSQMDINSNYDDAPIPPTGIRDHDCAREAYEVLGNLSFPKPGRSYSISSSGRTSGSAAGSTTNGVPFDHVLRISREASERLCHLLACSCARSPNLAFLYASNISLILTWYQQAAASMQSPPWGCTTVTTTDSASHHVSPTLSSPSSGTGSGGGSSTWSSTGTTTFGSGSTRSTPAMSPSTSVVVSPTTMAIGTFNVDDLRVQTALKIQLLLGEMRLAGRLIEQFIKSHKPSGQCLSDEPSLGSADSLYQSLDSWLKAEHSRISNMMRSKLRELNT
ncbi:hypothetical protein AAE478_005337 [Parahypoxylon ruwenzoriense]